MKVIDKLCKSLTFKPFICFVLNDSFLLVKRPKKRRKSIFSSKAAPETKFVCWIMVANITDVSMDKKMELSVKLRYEKPLSLRFAEEPNAKWMHSFFKSVVSKRV